MLDYIEQRYQIESIVVEGQIVRAALLDLQAALPRHFQRTRVRIYAGDLTVVRQVVGHVTCAAADVQNAPVRSRSHVAVQVAQDRTRAAGEPPVLVFFQYNIHWGVHGFS